VVEEVNTPIRNVRINDEIWQAIVDLADKKETTASNVVRQALVNFVQTGGEQIPKRWWQKV
jgi:predicted transcriptional regulator